ncbi:MAG: HDOD domain-containing protein [Gammaproteobacteria bacterium]
MLIHWTFSAINSDNSFTPPLDMRESIAGIKALPPLPGTAARIMELISDPKADVEELAKVIELDPILAAQVIRWASSALYGYRGKITTVRNAIVRVLGFNFVLDMALGLSVMAPLRAPKQGAVGTHMFWIHSLASSRLMIKLAKNLPAELGLKTEEVFLAALLHNIGFPLFGHQFPAEFRHLSKLINANPTLSIYHLETYAFGVNHAQMGAWLMNAWSMPQVLIDIVYHHHNPNYRGDNHLLNALTYLNDYLLGQLGIGDAINQKCPDEVWTILKLEPTMGFQILENIRSEIQPITEMADNLTTG